MRETINTGIASAATDVIAALNAANAEFAQRGERGGRRGEAGQRGRGAAATNDAATPK